MANPFSVDWYPDSFLGAVLRWTREQIGAYTLLLNNQIHGRFTDQEAINICGSVDMWNFLKHKFIQDEKGFWYNQKMDKEIIKKHAYINSRSNNAKNKENQAHAEHMPKHVQEHMPKHMRDKDKDKELGEGNGEIKKGMQVETKFTPDFLRFWDVWSKFDSRGKKPAFEKAWINLPAGFDVSEIIAGAERYHKFITENKTEPGKIKMAQGWLNDHRWKDETVSNKPSWVQKAEALLKKEEEKNDKL